ncbi:glycosyl hydrolase family 38 [Asanoa ferruginea]|uniref:Glycosyl hydrolase family 38 n=1 Tax=Asanoa ferruginea TaxID=53367 RepID=A0A3D9ZRL5_9ACTN|nr:glycoside hydrolase family 38 C-terminal domain-containing protein [Asanoa ferruginea]REG00027.1 glycosyl hydrolase family 38 [Asanoa ferruginea]GIF53723.1 alpha-mannosidase [Asanoa ferruginea]
MSLRITSISSTDLFVGTVDEPRQVVRIAVAGARPGVPVEVEGFVADADATGVAVVEVAVDVGGPTGAEVPVTVTARAGGETVHGAGTVVVAEPGWTVHLVSHFHYDPVWWNTQAAYTSEWNALPGAAQEHRAAYQHTGFDLVRTHLELARRDPDYKFVLAEVDYLKPYWDCYPQDRDLIRRLLAEGRLELMGGTYNEPNTNLTGAETTIRNVVHGLGFQRDVLGGDPATAWQLDAFGHDPQFPGIMADAGLTSSSWARGPFHQWGPMMRVAGDVVTDASAMQFPSEFEWIAPSGQGLLTSYMPAHYSAGWWMDSAATLAEAEEAVLRLWRLMRPAAATRHIMLPVGTDYSPPNKWLTEIHRDWNSRYLWPRLVCSLPRDFFAAVRASLTSLSPQTRDMNPIYTGKDVSYIDTKQAHRVVENLVVDAEKWATLASVHGDARYPVEALDRAWRLLIYGAHHDAITGTESDQVYLDLLAGWREAHDLARGVHDAAVRHLGDQVDTTGPGSAVLVFNPSSWSRTDVVTVSVPSPAQVVDSSGDAVPSVRCGDRLTFLARDVPSLGQSAYRLVPSPVAPGWSVGAGLSIANSAYRLTVDPARGGTVSSLVELATGRELLRPGRVGNEILVYDEYAEHPEFHEGPWHLLPTGGPVVASGSQPASSVRVEHSPVGSRIVVTGSVGPVRYTQTLTLWHGLSHVDCVTRVDEFTGSDHLVRLRWPVGVPGGLPLSEVANAVVARGFAHPDVDSARHPWTLDNPAYRWFGSGTTARVTLTSPDSVGHRAIGVAEVIVPEPAELGRPLAVALVRAGVTATSTTASGPRYGRLEIDSNLPDVRISVGSPARNAFTAAVLAAAGPDHAAAFDRQLAATGAVRMWLPAARPLDEVWQPSADLTGLRDLPVLLVASTDDDAAAVAALVADLAEFSVPVAGSFSPEAYEDRTVAVLNRGVPGFAVTADGGLHLSLLRSCTGWPTGVWIDPPRRTAPDGSPFALQHWTHSFEYALTSSDGDWRAGGITARAHDYNHPLVAVVAEAHPGSLPASSALLTVSPGAVLTALKATGDPLASGRPAAERAGVTARVYEPHGRTATVRLAGPGLTVAGRADVVERPRPGDPSVLEPFEIETWLLNAAPGSSSVELGPRSEPVQPVYARYWLHNKGPAPMGNQPVSVHLHRAASGAISVTVASDLVDGPFDGTVWIEAPAGWTADPAERPVRLEPGGWTSFGVDLVPGPDAAAGGVVTAQLEHAGSTVEDVLALGDAGPALSAELDVDELRLRAGQRATITLSLANPAGYAVHGEAQVISPWGTWDMLAPHTQGFALDAGGKASVSFGVTVPTDATPGTWWALAKVMWFGRVAYTAPVRLVVEP